ncbi:hypothetical protein MKW92_043156 [Papaver armeniacum]|nr:hypothetical protein MKW92_043156 [Papaver armeniacum]
MAEDPVRVLVTGAAGQIGYALVPMIARGVILGADQSVILHMLDIPPAAEALNGVKMELVDAAFPLLKVRYSIFFLFCVVATTDVVKACKGVDIAVMVGGVPRKEGMERKDVMSKNVSIYKSQASALEVHAAANCKRLSVQFSDVKNVIVWGNQSSTQYPDVTHANVKTSDGEKAVRELVADDARLNGECISTVQRRGAAIIKARKFSSALSAASSAGDHIRDWVAGTPERNRIICFSLIVSSRNKLDKTAEELSEVKALAYSCLV